MKKTYVRPVMEAEIFAANEVVAACGDSGTQYKFECEAGGGEVGLVTYSTGKTVHYHACSEKHTANSTDEFVSGTYAPCINGHYGLFGNWECDGHGNPVSVIIWTGPRGGNTHCTTELDMKKWEIAKS